MLVFCLRAGSMATEESDRFNLEIVAATVETMTAHSRPFFAFPGGREQLAGSIYRCSGPEGMDNNLDRLLRGISPFGLQLGPMNSDVSLVWLGGKTFEKAPDFHANEDDQSQHDQSKEAAASQRPNDYYPKQRSLDPFARCRILAAQRVHLFMGPIVPMRASTVAPREEQKRESNEGSRIKLGLPSVPATSRRSARRSGRSPETDAAAPPGPSTGLYDQSERDRRPLAGGLEDQDLRRRETDERNRHFDG